MAGKRLCDLGMHTATSKVADERVTKCVEIDDTTRVVTINDSSGQHVVSKCKRRLKNVALGGSGGRAKNVAPDVQKLPVESLHGP
ncbi:MAG: hypothetical protein AABZ47_03665, partial [Planctomycetota bacterium]